MTTSVHELWDNRIETVSSDRPTLSIQYMVRDAADEAAVKSAIASGTPSSFGVLTRTSYTIDERVDETTWKVTKTWERPDIVEDEPDVAFDTGGLTQHIKQSISTVASYGDNPPDNQGAIGFDGENVQGVDITVPQFSWKETHLLESVDAAYFGTIFSCTGKVNDGSFRGFSAGEVLFLGANGSRKRSGEWEITFSFSASQNLTSQTIGGIVNINKGGWEYLWVRYAEDVDGNRLIRKPVAVYVEKVYEEADFDDLDLPDWTT
jgi:hypothetical protein